MPKRRLSKRDRMLLAGIADILESLARQIRKLICPE